MENLNMNYVHCIVTVPADDINFKAALGYASGSELKEALEQLNNKLKVGFAVKTRIKAVEREIKKRER